MTEEDILQALTEEAERLFGSERLASLRETLKQTAAELHKIYNCPLDPEDGP